MTTGISRGIAIGGMAVAALLFGAGGAQAQHTVGAEARDLHERLLTLDTHLDSPLHFGRVGWDITRRHTMADDGTQLDLPRMAEGGLDGGFFVTYIPQGPLTPTGYDNAFADALRRIAAVRQRVARHPDYFALAQSAEDARRIAAEGKRIVFQSMENGYPLAEDLGRLAVFRALGVTMAGPVHSRDNQLADSATGTGTHGGLSPLGRQWVARMNALGMVIDASHASDAAFDQILALSSAPIVLSHSGVKAIYDHPRNIDDDRLRRLAQAGGVIQLNSVFLERFAPGPELGEVMDRFDRLEDMAPADQHALVAARARLAAAEERSATFDDFMRALLHCIQVAGIDHVGIGADWDGGGGVIGMEDVAALPRITAALRDAGYDDAAIAKIWGGNVLRVMDAAQALRTE